MMGVRNSVPFGEGRLQGGGEDHLCDRVLGFALRELIF